MKTEAKRRRKRTGNERQSERLNADCECGWPCANTCGNSNGVASFSPALARSGYAGWHEKMKTTPKELCRGGGGCKPQRGDIFVSGAMEMVKEKICSLFRLATRNSDGCFTLAKACPRGRIANSSRVLDAIGPVQMTLRWPLQPKSCRYVAFEGLVLGDSAASHRRRSAVAKQVKFASVQ